MDSEALKQAIDTLAGAIKGQQSGAHWGYGSSDFGQLAGQRRINPRDALRGAQLGVIDEQHTLELDELRGLEMRGLGG